MKRKFTIISDVEASGLSRIRFSKNKRAVYEQIKDRFCPAADKVAKRIVKESEK